MYLNTIYTTFQGEVNKFGIGHPVIFIRLQGCPLRCYKKTLGFLCDTPEALEKPSQKGSIDTIIGKATALRDITGIKLITLTGGDPLYNNKEDLKQLINGLIEEGFFISIETSGALDWRPYQIEGVSLVVDYKSPSTGETHTSLFNKSWDMAKSLREDDFIKFVVKDEFDMGWTINMLNDLILHEVKATLAVGAFWGGEYDTFKIYYALEKAGLAGKVTLNMQAHKLALNPNFEQVIPKEI